MIWILLAVIIIVALAAYAGWLHYKLWKHSNRRQTEPTTKEKEALNSLNKTSVDVSKSIYLIADAMLNDKMTHTEACLRICALSNHLPSRDTFSREYGVLFAVAEATAHFPILDQWKSLDKNQQKAFTRERQQIEKKYADGVIDAIKRVRVEFRPS